MAEVDCRSGNALPEPECSNEVLVSGNNEEESKPADTMEIPATLDEDVARGNSALPVEASEERHEDDESHGLNDREEPLPVIEPVTLGESESDFPKEKEQPEVKCSQESLRADASEERQEEEESPGLNDCEEPLVAIEPAPLQEPESDFPKEKQELEEKCPEESLSKDSEQGCVEIVKENGVISEVPSEGVVVEEVQEFLESDGNVESMAEGKIDGEMTANEEETVLEESEIVKIEPHWLPKPSVRVTVSGGSATEEELSSLFKEHDTISSITFENDKGDAAVIRFDSILKGDQLVTKIQENTTLELGERTLNVEAYHSDALLFVGNLTPDIDDTSLKNMFEPHGKIERAFIVRNSGGRSKGYGFVEYNLKSQAFTAKSSMNTMNMDGRVLRVEWSHCQSVKDMFSTVLFVDRVTKRMPNVENALRSLFGQFGEVKDCCLAVGINGSIRGFGFIDFVHSACADKAKEALDGREFGGLNLRVSFANPSKSAQSYKQRIGGQASVAPGYAVGRGTMPGTRAPVRGTTRAPYGGYQMAGDLRHPFTGPGMAMALNRDRLGPRVHDHSMFARGSGMLGSFPAGAGIMARPPNFHAHGPHSGSQVAVPQELYGQMPHRAHFDQPRQLQTQSYPQQTYQQYAHQSYLEHPQQEIHGRSYQQHPRSYHQPTQPPVPPQYQSPQQQVHYPSQTAESYGQSYQHQPPQQQYTQAAGYYQRPPTPQDQYALQYGQSYEQAPAPVYGQPAANNVQTYQQPGVPDSSDPYAQPVYQGAPQTNAQQSGFGSNYQQQQQIVSGTGADVGQKRSYDQMDASQQNFTQQQAQQYGGYPSGYQQAGQQPAPPAPYQQASGYPQQQPNQAYYQQQPATAEGYYQQQQQPQQQQAPPVYQSAPMPAQDDSKRPRF